MQIRRWRRETQCRARGGAAGPVVGEHAVLAPGCGQGCEGEGDAQRPVLCRILFLTEGVQANPSKKALAEAPLVIVLCAEPQQSGAIWGQNYYLVDAGIAAENLMLAARAQGSARCSWGSTTRSRSRDPEHTRERQGHWALSPRLSSGGANSRAFRKQMQEICFHGMWGEP